MMETVKYVLLLCQGAFEKDRCRIWGKAALQSKCSQGRKNKFSDRFNKLETNSQAEEASTSENQPTQPVVTESVPVDISKQKDVAVNLQCNICLGVPLNPIKTSCDHIQ